MPGERMLLSFLASAPMDRPYHDEKETHLIFFIICCIISPLGTIFHNLELLSMLYSLYEECSAHRISSG
jgi:hypothetical protein